MNQIQPVEGGWWAEHENMIVLTEWMADNGYTAHDVAYAVAKPWKYRDEYTQATRAAA